MLIFSIYTSNSVFSCCLCEVSVEGRGMCTCLEVIYHLQALWEDTYHPPPHKGLIPKLKPQ